MRVGIDIVGLAVQTDIMKLRKLTPAEIARRNLDAHAVKKEWRPNVDMGRLDLFTDENGKTWIANKDGNPESADQID